jgi:NitT/TauT family transport system substrate-binding protein
MSSPCRFPSAIAAATDALLAIAAGVLMLGASLSASAAADHVKIGVVRSLGGAPAYVAKDKGWFAAEGLDAELVFFDSAQPVAVAVASGDVDFGTTGLSAAFFNLAGQGALRIIGSSTWETPGFQNTGFLASNQAYAAGLTSLKDIGGHSAAITQSGTPLHYLLAQAAAKYGIDFKSIRVLLLQSNPNVATALAGGQTDIALQTAGPAYTVIGKGGAKLLGWAGDELPRQQGEAQFTSTSMANAHGDVITRYLRAYRKAMAYTHDALADEQDHRRDGPNADEVVAITAKYLQQPPDLVKRGFPFFDPQARIVAQNFVDLAAWYKAQNMLKGELDVKALIDTRYALLFAPR